VQPLWPQDYENYLHGGTNGFMLILINKRVAMKNNQKGIGAVVIIVIIAVVAAIGVGAYFVFNRGKEVATNAVSSVVKNAETQKALDDCKKEYNDEDLCKGLSNFVGLKQYQTTMTSTGSGAMNFAMEVDGEKTYTKQTFNGKTLETITIGNTTYTKDNSDGKWWKQVFETTKPTATADDFKFDTNIGDTTTKTTYTKIGEEPCDKLTCIKYKITDSGSTDTQYIWIDTKDHLVRKWSTESKDGSKTEMTYTYNKKSVDAPTNTKDASPTQMVVPADFYSGMTSSTDSSSESSQPNWSDTGADSGMSEEVPAEE